ERAPARARTPARGARRGRARADPRGDRGPPRRPRAADRPAHAAALPDQEARRPVPARAALLRSAPAGADAAEPRVTPAAVTRGSRELQRAMELDAPSRPPSPPSTRGARPR